MKKKYKNLIYAFNFRFGEEGEGKQFKVMTAFIFIFKI